MNSNYRRIALLTGVSAAAMGISVLSATPALAAPHDVAGPGVYAGILTSDDDVTICDIATADPSCFFGVYATGTGVVAAVVNTPAAGQLVQSGVGPDVALTLTNAAADSAEVGAIAEATNAAGNATANASVSNAIVQTGSAGDISLTLVNDGALLVDADASATATGVANANASLSGGIAQIATGTAVALSIANNGTATVAAVANASGATANALALASGGLVQIGSASATGDANVAMSNAGTLDVAASANATATAATGAAAANADGLVQIALGGTQASATFDNSGSYDVVATANGAGPLAAIANASVTVGLSQLAAITGDGSALASADNSGTINIAAIANAVQAPTTTGTATVTGTGATANAVVNNGVIQSAFAGTAVVGTGTTAATVGGDASATLTNSGAIAVAASAMADGDGGATANAGIGSGISQSANAGAGAASVSLTNAAAVGTATGTGTATTGGFTGTIDIAANANAVAAAGSAVAHANLTTPFGAAPFAIQQNASGATASASVINSGAINIAAVANATGTAGAEALAGVAGLTQRATGSTATANFSNSGAFAVAGTANASGSSALAVGSALGVIQRANGALATITADNSGLLTVDGVAVANGSNGATAAGVAGNGLVQRVTLGALATESLTNSGTVAVSGSASAIAASGAAVATGLAYFGLEQAVFGATTASQLMTNSGEASVVANAVASGAASASANAYADSAMFQTAVASNANQTMTNSGTATVSANANAIANGAVATIVNGTGTAATTTTVPLGTAFANASAFGIGQRMNATVGTQSLTNSGVLNVAANAVASGLVSASANADATGAFQVGNAGTTTFQNSGSITASAAALAAGVPFATATGTGTAAGTTMITAATGAAHASAYGYVGVGFGVAAGMDAAITNSGTMTVSASATAPATAVASAAGIVLRNNPTTTSTVVGTGTAATTVFTDNGNPATGTINNSGTLNVAAFASGGTATATVVNGTGATATTVTTTTPLSAAAATGIRIESGVNTMVVTNSGAINVDAVTANGGVATAYGVRAVSNGVATPGVDDVFTFTNDGGTMVVRQSSDGGATWARGMAIDVAASPNPSIVNLLGDGSIYGNIDVVDGDVINVESGSTVFDGIINPEFLPAGGVTGANLDTGLFGEGTLNIGNGGNLVLVSGNADATMDNGPAYAFVNTLNVASDGQLTFNVSPLDGGTQPVGSYPQVFADTANLDGTLELAFTNNTNGLFADSYFFDNLIDANTRNGTFDQCVITGVNANSPLLDFSGCIYDDLANVDVGLNRVAFNDVDNLTRNQSAVATALENSYNVDLTGDYGSLVAELFTLDSPDLVSAFDQLSGVEYPNYLHAVRNNSFLINSVVSDQLDCAIDVRGLDGCRTPENVGRVWITGTYNKSKLDPNSNAIGYEADSWSAMVGGDYRFGNTKVGAFVGYRDIDVDYPDAIVGSGIKAKGWQLGLDAAYDVGSFYVRGIGSYSDLNGDSDRQISIGTISARASGNPDLKVWSFYGEAGARFDLGGSWVTPYAAIDHTSMKMKAFTETGGLGANLDFSSQTEKQTSGLIGVKWAGNFNGIIPEAKIAYRHDFQNDFGVDTGFAGIANGTFRKFETYADDSAVVGLSLAGAFGTNLTGRIGYQGRFNSDVKDHGLFGTLTYLFGGATPPPPAPPVQVAPPPPPPPATQTCPDGSVILATDMCPPAPPPPPPAPPVTGERG